MKPFINYFKFSGFAFVALSMLVFGIAGCSSGGSSYVNPIDEGEIVISLTDTAGDFATYTVDVLSLNLTKANGAEVAALPLSTRIDFAQYTEMTEFLTAATVPSGTYVAATMTLDYRNADIRVDNGSDESVQVADIVDENGDPITTLEVSVQLEDRNSLTIVRGVPAHLMLDFDLQASNQIDFAVPEAPVLTVDPFLVAEVDRTDPYKFHRIRGLFNEVNLDENTFSVILRPFYCALTDTHSLYGIRSVATDENTVYHINGNPYEGHEGLAALGDLPRWTPVVALGSLKFNPLRFEAWEVYAGTSVPGAGLDVVSGWVTERTGDTLVVKGASLIRSGSTFIFNDEVTVQVAETTLVSRQISSSIYSKDDISIGQHITAFGTLTNVDPENLEMDATAGMVRMMLTTIRGTVVSFEGENPNTQLTMDLQSIGRFRVGVFNFLGTGETSAYDADPENYEIYTGTMDLSAVTAETPVKLKGFPEPFGMAPPDFAAFTLIDVADLEAFMRINLVPATGAPFTELSTDGLTLNLEGTGWMHYMVRGNVVTDLYDLSTPPVIAADEDGRGLYILKYDGVTEIHTIFENFVPGLEGLLEDGYAVRKINAMGRFDDATSVLTVDVVEIHLAMIP
jgi:hypothetical protein